MASKIVQLYETDGKFQAYQFIPLVAGLEWNHGGEKDTQGFMRKSKYVKGMTYTVRTEKLDRKVKDWAKAGKVQII